MTNAGSQRSVLMDTTVDALFPTTATSLFITLFWSQVWHDHLFFSLCRVADGWSDWSMFYAQAGMEPHICLPPQFFKWLHQLTAFCEPCVINGLLMSSRSHYGALAKPLSLSVAVGSVLNGPVFIIFFLISFMFFFMTMDRPRVIARTLKHKRLIG